MKQLRIIANNYNNENGLMQVNYNENIIVPPGSKIAMDKFTMDVTNNGSTSNIILSPQNIAVNCDQPTQSPRIVTINGGTYPTIQSILAEWNDAANSILETSMVLADKDVPDNGLYFGSNLDASGNVDLLWGGCPMVDLTAANTELDNVTIQASGEQFIIDTPGVGLTVDWVIGTTVPIILGGVDIRFGLDQVDQADPNDYNTYEFGLCLDPSAAPLAFGIRRSEGKFYVVNGDEETEITGDEAFYEQFFIYQFFVDGGELRFQIIDPNDSSVAFITDTGAFSGFDFNTSYFMFWFGSFDHNVDGIVAPIFYVPRLIFQTNINELNTGFVYDFSSFVNQNHVYWAGIDGVDDRTVRIDFTSCPTLQEGLGFAATIYENRQPLPNYIIEAENPASFDIYYDLALDIPSLQLESYIASTDRGVAALSGRKNYLCYFVPQRVEGNKNIYVFTSPELHLVDLSMKNTVDLNSMQFRVIFPNSPTSILKCESLSFNLYIQEPPSL